MTDPDPGPADDTVSTTPEGAAGYDRWRLGYRTPITVGELVHYLDPPDYLDPYPEPGWSELDDDDATDWIDGRERRVRR